MPIEKFRNITATGFDEDALAATQPNDRVQNFATLTTTCDLTNGVSIDNFGQIETRDVGAEAALVKSDVFRPGRIRK